MWLDEEQNPLETSAGEEETPMISPEDSAPQKEQTAPPEADVATSTAVAEQPATEAPTSAVAREPIVEEPPPSESHAGTPVGEDTISIQATESPQAAQEEAPTSTTDEEEYSMDAAMEQMFRTLETGEIIEATVVHVDKESVLVDVGTKAEGVIPLQELSEQRLDSAEGVVAVGDKINVMVIRPEGIEGNPELSKRRADLETLWEKIEQVHDEGSTLYAMVVERVKGGLVVDMGVRGFIPASHVGLHGNLRNLDRFVGESLPVKVMDIDRERRKVVVSNRKAEEELHKQRVAEREQRQKEIFNQLKIGDVLNGEVKRLTPYGAFVDIGGYEGLLHVSEMSWSRVEDPKDVLKEGEKIQVMILRLDPDRGKVSLGLRQVLPDPWSQIPGRYHIGETAQVTISRLVRNGAFVRLQEGVEAFIPISELSHKRIRRPEDVVSVGQTVEALVTEIKPDQRRMVMSLRALQEEAERKQVERVRRSEPKSTGFTIADRLQGQLGEFLRPGDETGTPSENEHSENTTENEHSDHTTNEVAEEVNEKETETAETEGGASTNGG